MKKKIVIACQTCGYLVRDIIKEYVAKDYEVTLLASKSSWASMEKDLYTSVKCRFVKAYDKSSTIKRLTTWMISATQMYFKLLFHHRHDEVLYVSNPPFAPLLPLVLRNKFSLLIWDIYPDVLVSQNVFKNSSWVVRWWEKKNKKVFAKAKHTFTLSDGMKECLAKYVDEKHIIVVPLWPDSSNLQRIEKADNLFIKNNHLEGKFVVMYSGNIGNTHRMDVLVDVAKNIENEDIMFVLIGEGGKKKMIEQRIKDEGLKNMMLLPYQPYDFLSHSLSAADIAVITLDTASSQMSVPSKTFNMMSLGAPLMCIASPDSELGRLVAKYQVGKCFMPEDIEKMTQYVIQLKKDNDLHEEYRNNSLEAAKYFTRENAKMFVTE